MTDSIAIPSGMSAALASVAPRALPALPGGFARALERASGDAPQSGCSGGMSATLPGVSASMDRPAGGADLSPEQAQKTAREFVSMSLVQPILAQLRKTNAAWGPFKPGNHEQQFGPLIDAEVAMRITRASNFPIVDAVARNLMTHAEGGEKPATETAA